MTVEDTRVQGRAQRIQRWQALVEGAGSADGGARRSRRPGSTNLLMGVWLHAAARAEQGRELTDFEAAVLAPLGRVFGEDEISAVGRLYSEQCARGGAEDVVPQPVATRPLSEGFTAHEYREAVAALGPVVLALPNTQIVDRAALLSGEDFDTAEFTAAVGEYGFGVTGFAGDDLTEEAVRAPFRARLEWGGFYCHEAAGDQGGGRDEIYWLAASATDGYGYHTRTGETGGVESGREYSIPGDWDTGSMRFFDTPLEGCLAVLVTCMEADDSGAAWYDALGAALGEIVETMKLSADFSGVVPGMDVYSHMYTGLSFLDDIWQHILNQDDLIMARGFAVGRTDLAALYARPGRVTNWGFYPQTGMGRFTLRVKYTGDKPGDAPQGAGSPLAQNWPGLVGTTFTRDLDAACKHPSNPNDVYLFQGSDYLRYDVTAETIYIGPKSIVSGWPGLRNTPFTSGIDAVCIRPNTNQVYMFKGSQYTRYNLDNEKMVDGVLNIAAEWPGLRNTIFTSDIDAAVNVPGSGSDLYFFKGDTYVRYNLPGERIVVGPTKIAQNWTALAGNTFSSHLDAACGVPGNHTDIYFFQEARYIRVKT